MCGSREADAQDSTTTGTPPGARPMLVLALASAAAMPEGIPEDCNLDVQVRVTANGYEGHHDYSIRVDMPAAPGVTLALDFSRAGGFNPAHSDGVTWVKRTLTSSPQSWNLHIKTQQHLNSGMVNIGCTPPPPSPPRPPPPRPPSPPRPPPRTAAAAVEPGALAAATIFGIEPDEPVPMGMVVGALAAGLAVLCLCAVGIVHLMRQPQARRPERAQQLAGHDEDEDEDDEEDDDNDDDDDDFDEEAGGSGSSDDGGDEFIEALVEVQGQVHEVSVKLADCASFADLSQRVHEACEDAGLPALPLNGLMHMVLSIDGKPVPVTRSTQFARLADAERLRVTIGADPATRKPSSNVGAKKGRK